MNDDTNRTEKLDPRRTTLLVMDYQPGILGRLDDSDALTDRAAEAIGTMRTHGGTVGYVRVAFEEAEIEAMPPVSRMAQRLKSGGHDMAADSPATQVDERVAPEGGDIVVRKVRVGPFGTTDLDGQLRNRGIDTLVLAGVSTSGVVLSAVRDASDRDYRLLVLSDATTDPEPGLHEFLTGRIFPRQADVIEVADLAGLLA